MKLSPVMVPTRGNTINHYVTVQSWRGTFIPRAALAAPPDGGQSRTFSSSHQRERCASTSNEKGQVSFLGFCFLFDPHVKLFLVQHIRSAISEIQKWLLQLDLFHILLQPHLTPAPHHPVYIYSYWQPSTYLSAIFYISQSFIFFKFHCTPSSAQAQCCWILHPLSPNSSLLCFTYSLCSLHDFPHPCHSSWFGSIRTQEVCDFVCVKEREQGRNDNLGLLQVISQRSGWEGALQSFLSFLLVTLKLVFLHSNTVKVPKHAQHYCRHLFSRACCEVYRCCDPRSDLAEEMKGAAGQKWLS